MTGLVGHNSIHSGQAGIWIQMIVPEDSIFLGEQSIGSQSVHDRISTTIYDSVRDLQIEESS